ncbi:MAG: DUF1569 domain-containing protein [Lacipirellulaceae bacterium]
MFTATPVNTKEVKRRELDYASLDEVLAEAEQAAAQNASTQGNWSLAMIFDHLAKTIDCSLDGFGFKAPFFFRIAGPLMRKMFLGKPMPAGFQLSKEAAAVIGPSETETSAALDHLRTSIRRFQSSSEVAHHPFFGKMTYDEYDLLHRRHAGLHMSFINL